MQIARGWKEVNENHWEQGQKGVDSFERKVENIHHTSEREILWADTNEKRSREFMATHLYPRLLYTFSDVVVFVLNNPRSVSLEARFRWNYYYPLCLTIQVW